MLIKKIISSTSNSNVKKALEFVVEAIELAEQTEKNPSKKLECAVNFIKEKVKGISKKDAIKVIETAVSATKSNVNNQSQENKNSSNSRCTL